MHCCCSYTRALEDGMIPPLSVTTAAQREQQRTAQTNRYNSSGKSPGKDWDTRTSMSGKPAVISLLQIKYNRIINAE